LYSKTLILFCRPQFRSSSPLPFPRTWSTWKELRKVGDLSQFFSPCTRHFFTEHTYFYVLYPSSRFLQSLIYSPFSHLLPPFLPPYFLPFSLLFFISPLSAFSPPHLPSVSPTPSPLLSHSFSPSLFLSLPPKLSHFFPRLPPPPPIVS
jgi:hypothetical protein